MSFGLLVLACLLYVAALFTVAWLVDRRAPARSLDFLRSPFVYTLSLSIYCTAWTFYGAVGYAARSGLEYMTIYLGPSLVFIGWWWLLRKLVRIGRQQGVTSIADLISSRYGKSTLLGVIVTVIAVLATTPYIALQLQSVVLSFGVFAAAGAVGDAVPDAPQTAIWVAAGLALFTILFGTRNLDAREQHRGIIIAIAVEAVVKLVALIAVGVWVVWGLSGGIGPMLALIDASPLSEWELRPGRWGGLILLSAAAVLCLPRMFQVMVVEAPEDRHLARASWAFPAYLLLMSLFIVPIATMGLERLPEGANPDLFMLSLPLAEGQGALAMLAFLGGFSSATSMVIVETIALSTMVSNHIVMPTWLWLRRTGEVTRDVRRLVILSRRLAILVILALGYAYYRASGGSGALAAIGLIAFVGVAQVLPAMIGGLFWRGATRRGAAAGLITGIAVWSYALFLPSFGPEAVFSAGLLADGPFGIDWLRPGALFGVERLDPLIHALMWSLFLNLAAFCLVSLLTFPGPVERVQSAAFVHVFEGPTGAQEWSRGKASAEDLLIMAQDVLGEETAVDYFRNAAQAQGKTGYLPDPAPDFLTALEGRLASSVGAAAAHAMVGQLAGRSSVTVEELMAVANETAQVMEYSARLEAQQGELARTAGALREANEKLMQLSLQKDSFLSQVSHELRTPMTSIRAFSEILASGPIPPEQVTHFGQIILDEARRLTRLLDDLLDLSVLENGTVQLSLAQANLSALIDKALMAAAHVRPDRDFTLRRNTDQEQLFLRTDPDRLTQVLINLFSNARKYCDAARPELRIVVRPRAGRVMIDVIDNGRALTPEEQALIFEKFARLPDETKAGGAGLGLSICREVMASLGGAIGYLPGQGGAAFRVTVPLRLEKKAA